MLGRLFRIVALAAVALLLLGAGGTREQELARKVRIQNAAAFGAITKLGQDGHDAELVAGFEARRKRAEALAAEGRVPAAARMLAALFEDIRQAVGDAAPAAPGAFGQPVRVRIAGLPIGAGRSPISTEEPFVSRDGRWLFFNSGEKEGNKDLHVAERTARGWRYRGEIGPGVNTPDEVQGNPTMDRDGRLTWIESSTDSMVRRAAFDATTAQVSEVADVAGFPSKEVRLFAQEIEGNMGVELTADGELAFFSRARWDLNGISIGLIEASDLGFATREGDRFVVDEAEVARVLANVNTETDLEYAASISEDDLELFFTRLPKAALDAGEPRSMILRATRATTDAPFEAPEVIETIGRTHFVEGPAISPDGRSLYYHQREGEKFRLFRVTR